MKREQLEHVLRAASRIAEDHRVLVLGSQSILGSHHEEDLPPQAWASIEADLAFFDDHDLDKADAIDMHLGEDSRFHVQFGYYGQGVEISTAVLPVGWRDRTVTYRAPGAEPAVALCLDPHDLVVAKLVANREKDRVFAIALLDAGLVEIDLLSSWASTLEVPLHQAMVTRWLAGYARRSPIV